MPAGSLIVLALSSVLIAGGRSAFRTAPSRREATVALLYSLLGLLFAASWFAIFPADFSGLMGLLQSSGRNSPRLTAALCCSAAIAFLLSRFPFHRDKDRPAIVKNLGRWRPPVSLSPSKQTPVKRLPFEYLAEELRSKRAFLKGLGNTPLKRNEWR
jgi:hypothetical protein